MRAGAYILIIILCVLMVQPLFSYANTEPAESSCCKSKSKCDKPEPSDNNNDDCENNRCNPLMSCPTGNFYLLHYSYISIASLQIPKQKVVPVNDNRLTTNLTECWHPPEII